MLIVTAQKSSKERRKSNDNKKFEFTTGIEGQIKESLKNFINLEQKITAKKQNPFTTDEGKATDDHHDVHVASENTDSTSFKDDQAENSREKLLAKENIFIRILLKHVIRDTMDKIQNVILPKVQESLGVMQDMIDCVDQMPYNETDFTPCVNKFDNFTMNCEQFREKN